MDIAPPPPPPPPPLPYLVGVTPTTTTTTTTPPQAYNNGGIAANIPQIPQHTHHHHTSSHSPSGSSIIVVMIVISSAIIVSAAIYLLIRFLSRRSFRSTFSPSHDVVSDNRNGNGNGSNDDGVRHHAIRVANDDGAAESLPLFRFSSLTGKIAGGDCAVCLSRFEGVDQLRLLPLCCHAFHAECIDAWLKSNQTCPLCRSTVNPSEADVLNKISSAASTGRFGGNRSNSFRIEIGNVSQRREASDSDRRSYSIGSYEYVLDDGGGYEIPVESTHRRGGSDCTSVDKDSTAAAPEPPGNNVAAEVGGGGSGRRNWLRDYVDRFSVSRSSRSSQSFRGGSGRFFGGSLRRSETVEDYEATHGRIGEEISELFRWFSGV